MLPKGVQIVPYYDRTWLMDKTLSTVFRNLVEGALLVSLVLYLFLSNLRASLAVVVVIPLSLLATFLGLKVMGMPANLLSLGAMDFGIIVDGAVIVVENVMHRLAERRRGHDPERAARQPIADAANEVGRPTLFSMLIIIAAHIPIFTLQRHEGRIFPPMALSVTTALVGSLVFSLTLVPLLALLDAASASCRTATTGSCRGCKRATQPRAATGRSARRKLVIGLALGAFALALVAASRLGSEFLPELNEGTIWVNLRAAARASPTTRRTRVLHDVRRALLHGARGAHGGLQGRASPRTAPTRRRSSMAEVFVDIKPAEEWRKGLTREQLLDEMDRAVSAIPGMEPSFSQPIRDNVLESISQIDGQIVIKVRRRRPGRTAPRDRRPSSARSSRCPACTAPRSTGWATCRRW